jgi:endoplasmic reticulum-Golgi intermediate compartment protein 3
MIGQDNSTGLFQYFIRVIPTEYSDDYGNKVVTNQYTVTDRFRPLIMPKFDGTDKVSVQTVNDRQIEYHVIWSCCQPQPMEAILPGIFFVYQISPFMIEAKGSSIPFTHFLTKVCAIVGGVLTVMSVLDGLVFKIQKMLIK